MFNPVNIGQFPSPNVGTSAGRHRRVQIEDFTPDFIDVSSRFKGQNPDFGAFPLYSNVWYFPESRVWSFKSHPWGFQKMRPKKIETGFFRYFKAILHEILTGKSIISAF